MLEQSARGGQGPAGGGAASGPVVYYGTVESVDSSGEQAVHVVSVVVPDGEGRATPTATVLDGVKEVHGETIGAGKKVKIVVHPATGQALISRVPDAANVADKCLVWGGVTG